MELGITTALSKILLPGITYFSWVVEEYIWPLIIALSWVILIAGFAFLLFGIVLYYFYILFLGFVSGGLITTFFVANWLGPELWFNPEKSLLFIAVGFFIGGSFVAGIFAELYILGIFFTGFLPGFTIGFIVPLLFDSGPIVAFIIAIIIGIIGGMLLLLLVDFAIIFKTATMGSLLVILVLPTVFNISFSTMMSTVGFLFPLMWITGIITQFKIRTSIDYEEDYTTKSTTDSPLFDADRSSREPDSTSKSKTDFENSLISSTTCDKCGTKNPRWYSLCVECGHTIDEETNK